MPKEKVVQIDTQIFEVSCWLCGKQYHFPIQRGFSGFVAFNCCDEYQSHNVNTGNSIKSSTEPL